MDEFERRLTVVEENQKYMTKEMKELSESIRSLTKAIDVMRNKGANNWDKLMWLIAGAMVSFVFKVVVGG